VQVAKAFLERAIQDLHMYVQGCVAELVCNLDETGISDWEDRQMKKAVDAAMLGQTIHHGVARNVRRISVIACLSSAGESLLHYIVTSQNSSTVQDHLKTHGVHFDRDFALKFNQKLYFNAGIFLADIRTILLPYIDTFRGLAVLGQQGAVLLMDHSLADDNDHVIHFLTEARVRVATSAPHTIQIFQILDFALFGVLNRRPRCELPFDEANATVKNMIKVYRDFKQTMVPSNVWRAFHAFGLEFDMRKGP
jgi:hypothetical protein